MTVFDEIIDRSQTNSVKHDLKETVFGRKDVIPLWVADMDFRAPECISEAIKERASHEIYGYSFRPDSFYNAAFGWMKRRYKWEPHKNWFSFSPGIVPGINMTILALTSPADKIVIQPPVYFPFFDAVKNNKRTLIENPLFLRNGRYFMDFEDLEEKLKKGVKMLILSNPHNPGGSVWTEDELKKLGSLCHKYNTLIISDEIHADIIFNGNHFTPMASVSDDIAQRTISFFSPSKTFNIAGLATSVAVIPNPVLKKKYDAMVEQLHIGNGNLFGTVAFEAAYNHGDKWLDELLEYLWGNVLFIEDYLNSNIPSIKMIKPEGTYLAWLDCNDLNIPKEDIHRFMIEQAKVGFNEGKSFGSNGKGFERLNFGCPRKILEKALNNISGALKKFS
jgi:cystathionine beta-lyase